ncbi:hypothetical protein RBWH47_02828 [Rhodopirellula baltica WH47]|uniref:Uncharacterized protein n=1 Tax=Rhodopirellula baltica WH47 TaxID=991778 RepID=F2AZD5_RHOBT|nr:hypothetical protein RBWH47_02828 [Rhodopirellula baltica WH47]
MTGCRASEPVARWSPTESSLNSLRMANAVSENRYGEPAWLGD